MLNVALEPDVLNRNATAGMVGNQVQTTVAVNPNNANQLFAASNPWVFRYSTNGGAAWSATQGFLPTGCCDVQASWDRHGNLFVSYINQAQTAVIVLRSTNGGQNFIQVGSFAGAGLDQPSLDTGPAVSGSGFADAVCVSYRETSAVNDILARCAGVNGPGVTGAFTGAFQVPSSSGGNFSDLAIANTGAVLVAFQNPATGAGPSLIRVNTAIQGLLSGIGFGAGVTAANTNVGGATLIPAQATRGINAGAKVDCHHSSGWCYLAYVHRPSIASTDTDIILRKSLNGGAWAGPWIVNNDPTTNSQFNPALDVDQSNGNVGVTWLDARNAGVGNNRVQVYGTVQFFGNNFFWPNYRLSNQFSNCNTAGAFNCGDYDTGAFHGSNLFRSWADNSSPSGLTPVNTSLPSQDLAVSRIRVENADADGTLATAVVVLGMGPGSCEHYHLAKPIGNDGSGSGFGLRDVDLYRFTANAGTTLTVRTSLPAGGVAMNTVIRLFNAIGVQLAINDDDEPATDGYSRLTFSFTATNTYYIGISGSANSTYSPTVYGSGVNGDIGDYQLDMSLSVGPDLGDTVLTALNTGVGPGVGSYYRPCEVIGNGAFERRDVDLYRIQATAGQVLTALTGRVPDGDHGDTYLRVFNSAQVQVAANDDGGLGLDALINYVIPASGTYYVGVSAAPNNGYNPGAPASGIAASEQLHLGDYQLYVGLMAQPDPGDTLATSVNTAVGPLQGSYQLGWEVFANGVWGARDVDMFRFTANVGMRLSVATTLPPGAALSSDSYLRVFNAAGVEVASNDNCGPSAYSCINNFRIPATGTYYVGVSGGTNTAYNPNVAGSGLTSYAGDYRLNLSLVPGPAVGFQVTASVASTTAGTPFDVTARALDDGGNTATGYTGTVTFTTSDPSGGTLPANYQFLLGENGVHTFTGVALYVAEVQSITAAQVGSPGINGSVNVTINPGPVSIYYVYPGSELTTSVQVNVPLTIYIFPFDQFYNWITTYAGTISFYTPDPLGVVPGDYTFTGLEGGIGVPGSVTFGTLGSQELYVWDTCCFTAFGYAAYNVTVAPGGGGAPGSGQRPSGGVADLLAATARPAVAPVAAPRDRAALPRLDAQSVELLFARSQPVASPEGFGRPVQQHRPASGVERWFTLVQDESFQAV